jgi:hypothetical protein
MAWDIGYDDFNSCWVYQVLPNKIVFYYYHEQQHTNLIEFLGKIIERLCALNNQKWGVTICHLPHDAEQHSRQTGLTDRELLIQWHAKNPNYPITYPKPQIRPVQSGISACRVMFSACWFDQVGCELGLNRLGNYVEIIEDGNDGFSVRPRHDKSSHAADSYRYAITAVYQQPIKQQWWRKDPNQIYGLDIMSARTRRMLGL